MVTMLAGVSCSTSRQIQVRDESGQPVADALVVYREFNMSPFWNRVGTERTETNGVAVFAARGCVRAEAVAPDLRWGDLWMADKKAGLIVLTDSSYTGDVIDWYMSKTKDVPMALKERLQRLKEPKSR